MEKIKPRIHIKKLFLFLFFLLCSCQASRIEWEDIHSIKGNIEKVRAKSHKEIIRNLKNKKSFNYAHSFMLGMSHFHLDEFRNAILWFGRSYFQDGKRPSNYYPSTVYEHITSFKNKFKSKSPLEIESVYYISLCYHNLNENNYAIKFLDIIEEYKSHPLAEKMLSLRASIFSDKNIKQAIRIYKKLIRNFEKPIHYIRLASIFQKEKEYKKALFYYFKALEFTENQWAYQIAAKQLADIFIKSPALKKSLTNGQKAYYLEALRLLRKNKKAFSLFKKINPKKLRKKERYIYILSYARLLTDTRRYSSAVRYIKKRLYLLLPEDREKLIVNIARRFLRKDKYHQIYNLVPRFSRNREAMLIRLTALRKIKSAYREQEATYYLKNFDPDSSITERSFFSSCLDEMLKKKRLDALKCLENLAKLTKNVSVGGRSRYFIARLSKKKPKEIASLYRKVYLNSPSDFYVFKALKKSRSADKIPLPPNKIDMIRDWLSKQAGYEERINEFLEKRKKEPYYGVDPFWKEWENSLKEMEKNEDVHTRKALLLIGMGYTNLAKEYLPKSPRQHEHNFIYQKAGHLVDDPYLKYRYLKQYMIKKKKDVDIFTLSKKAMESLYPFPYSEYIDRASKKFSVEKARLYSLMKQESSFHPGVKSSAGATGLMQLMPRTARYVNKKIKIKNLNLTSPRHSILLGASFYAQMSKMFGDHFEKIAIAYNAGPGRLSRWKKKISMQDMDLFIEQIPFKETHLYVKRTRSYYDRYKILLNWEH